MSKNRNRKRNKPKNKNEDQSRDELYDEFLSMFGESVDPIEIFNVLKRNKWNADTSVDELMNLPKTAESGKPDTSMFDEDLGYLAIPSKSSKSSQNLNYSNFTPPSTNNGKFDVNHFNGFHDVKVVYKGENSADEADADIIIEEEKDFSYEHNSKVYHNSFGPFQEKVMNGCESNFPGSRVETVESNKKTLNSDSEKFKTAHQKYAPGASTSTSITTEISSPMKLDASTLNMIYQECLKTVDPFDRISNLVFNSIKVMILMRGVPGSGKSFTAEKVILSVNTVCPHLKLKPKNHIFSTDDYFMSPKHGYQFDSRMIPQAHEWNRERALKAVSGNLNPIIIDNTNTQIWEMAGYVQLSVEFGYVVEVLEPETRWKFNEYELFRRNIHGVPRANIRNMLERYEHGITRNNVLQMLKCRYHPSKQPPQIVPGQRINVNRNALKDNTTVRPPKSNGWPASSALESLSECNSSNSTESFQFHTESIAMKANPISSDGIGVEKNHQPNQLLKDNFSNETNYSNLTPSCRSFFEKSLLSSANDVRLGVASEFEVLPLMKNNIVTEEVGGGKSLKENIERSRAVSRNAIISNMIKDSSKSDLVAKTPSVPPGWLTLNSQEMPKPGQLLPNLTIEDQNVAKDGNVTKNVLDLIDFESREFLASDEDEYHTTEEEDQSEVTGMMSKLSVDMSKPACGLSNQPHAPAYCSSKNDSIETSSMNSKVIGEELKSKVDDSTKTDVNRKEIGELINEVSYSAKATEIIKESEESKNTVKDDQLNIKTEVDLSDKHKSPALKYSGFMENNLELSRIEYTKNEFDNVDEKVLGNATESFCKVDPVGLTPLQNVDLISDINVGDTSSNLQKNYEITQSSIDTTSQSKDSSDSVYDSKLSLTKENCNENISRMNDVESSKSSNSDTSVEGIEGDKCNEENSSRESSQESISSINVQIDSCTGTNNLELYLENGGKTVETSKQEFDKETSSKETNNKSKMEAIENSADSSVNAPVTPEKTVNSSDSNKTNDSEIGACGEASDSNIEKKILCESGSKKQPKTSNIDMKDFRFKPTRYSLMGSDMSNKDLFFSELKDDPVDDYFNDAEVCELLQSLVDLDLQFMSDEETDSSKVPDNESKMEGSINEHFESSAGTSNQELCLENCEKPAEKSKLESNEETDCPKEPNNESTMEEAEDTVSSSLDVPESNSTITPDKTNTSISDGDNISSRHLVGSAENSDESYQLNSSSSITVSQESILVMPTITSEKVEDLNTSSSMRILTDSYVTVAEDSNSDSLYFDVENIECEDYELTTEDGISNLMQQCANAGSVVESNKAVNSEEISEFETKLENGPEMQSADEEYKNDNDGVPLDVLNSKKDSESGNIETVSQILVTNEVTNEKNENEGNKLLKSKEKGEESVASQGINVESDHIEEQSTSVIDEVKALIKGGTAVKTFDVMTWLKSNFIKESSEGNNDIHHLMSESSEETRTKENFITTETNADIEIENLISNQFCENAPKPPRDTERPGLRQQSYSIVGSSQANNEDARKQNKLLVWDSVEEPENSWAEKMKCKLGSRENGHISKPQREKQPANSRLEGVRLGDGGVNLNEEYLTKVIGILSSNNKQTGGKIEKPGETESFGQKLEVLSNLFPESQAVYLEELLRQCQGDVNWAAGLLLEGGCEISGEAYCSEKKAAPELVEINKKSADEDINQASCSKSSSKKQKKEKKNANSSMSEARLELKKMIEQNFVLSENSYSEHLLKLLKFRRGEFDPDHEMAVEMMTDSYDLEFANTGDDGQVMAEQQFNGAEFPEQYAEAANPEDEETLEFVFNKDVITTLSYNFGSSGFPLDMTEVNCPVKLPMRLARELHSYWMDSVEENLSNENMRMQMMIKEDEELAKRLQQEEARAVSPNLQQVMDFETALMLHEADLKKTNEGNDATVAAKLAMSILMEKYPKEKEQILSELLRSNNYSLHDTLSLLKITNERELLQEQQISDDVRHELDDCDESAVFEESETLQGNYERSREEARTHFLKRNEYFQKAQQEYTSGNKAAASFYSQLANMHMKKMEDANCKAATLLLSTSHSKRNTLDLHFYHIKEALQVLDLFIDSCMARLEESRKQKMKIYIITGRGLHSAEGRSVMKPVVIRRLQQRKIRYQEMETNPGAIVCSLTRNSS